MIIYNVTINIDSSVHEEWLKWMKEIHVPEVMNTGCFLEKKFLKLIGEEESDEITYAIQYTCNSINDFYEYEKLYAPQLRAKHNEKYKDKFVAFRTLLEIAG